MLKSINRATSPFLPAVARWTHKLPIVSDNFLKAAILLLLLNIVLLCDHYLLLLQQFVTLQLLFCRSSHPFPPLLLLPSLSVGFLHLPTILRLPETLHAQARSTGRCRGPSNKQRTPTGCHVSSYRNFRPLFWPGQRNMKKRTNDLWMTFVDAIEIENAAKILLFTPFRHLLLHLLPIFHH